MRFYLCFDITKINILKKIANHYPRHSPAQRTTTHFSRRPSLSIVEKLHWILVKYKFIDIRMQRNGIETDANWREPTIPSLERMHQEQKWKYYTIYSMKCTRSCININKLQSKYIRTRRIWTCWIIRHHLIRIKSLGRNAFLVFLMSFGWYWEQAANLG